MRTLPDSNTAYKAVLTMCGFVLTMFHKALTSKMN